MSQDFISSRDEMSLTASMVELKCALQSDSIGVRARGLPRPCCAVTCTISNWLCLNLVDPVGETVDQEPVRPEPGHADRRREPRAARLVPLRGEHGRQAVAAGDQGH